VNEQALRPAGIAAAAIAIGGVLVAVFPQHGPSTVRLVIVTVAAAAGLYAVALHAPPAWWMSPFDRSGHRGQRGVGSDEVDRIRSTLSGRRVHIENGPPLPPETLRLLQPAIRSSLEREGIDPDDSVSLESAAGQLSPLTRAVLVGEPSKHAGWFRTLRPDARQVAGIVHGVMDDLDRFIAGGSDGGRTPKPARSRTR
jgi:hypothetical protein